MPQHDKDKNKKQSKPGVKVPVQSKGLGTGKYRPPSDWSPWKSTGMGYEERTRKTPGDWKPRTTPGGKDFDRAFGEATRAGKKTFTWGGKTYTTNMAGGTEKEMRKVGKDKTEKMTPVEPRKVDIPGVKSKRKVVGKTKVKPHVAEYLKHQRWKAKDWSPKGKGTKAKIAGALGAISPFHETRKGPGGLIGVGKRTMQSTTRPASEKEATTRSGDLKKKYSLAMPGMEPIRGEGRSPKRTRSGMRTEKGMATKGERKAGKIRLKKKEEDYQKNMSRRIY